MLSSKERQLCPALRSLHCHVTREHEFVIAILASKLFVEAYLFFINAAPASLVNDRQSLVCLVRPAEAWGREPYTQVLQVALQTLLPSPSPRRLLERRTNPVGETPDVQSSVDAKSV